jgi:hypothetical protein
LLSKAYPVIQAVQLLALLLQELHAVLHKLQLKGDVDKSKNVGFGQVETHVYKELPL